jgi:TatD DNase family protein
VRIFDSHCHLDSTCYEGDLDAVLQRAEQAGVVRMLVAGVTVESSRRAAALAETRPGLYASVGIHPHDARHCTEAALKTLERLAAGRRVRAWGEIGLDFNRMYSGRSEQEAALVRQLACAEAAGLPLIFHERDSRGRFLEILEAHFDRRRRGVVHCFSGSPADLRRYLDMGLHIGLTGILTMAQRGAGLRRLTAAIPDDRILVETDAPYLTPAPEKNRTRRNEPAFVRSVLLKLAEVKKVDLQQLADTVWHNTCRLFGLDP